MSAAIARSTRRLTGAGAVDGLAARGPTRRGCERARRGARRASPRAGFPTTRDEDWRYTDLPPLAKRRRVLRRARRDAAPAGVDALALRRRRGHPARLRRRPLRAPRSPPRTLPRGVRVGSLAGTLAEHARAARACSARSPSIARTVRRAQHRILRDGACDRSSPRRPRSTRRSTRCFVATRAAHARSHPRILLVAGRDARADARSSTTSALATARHLHQRRRPRSTLGAGARVEHYALHAGARRRLPHRALHARLRARQPLSLARIALGARTLAQRPRRACSTARARSARSTGCTSPARRQHVDHHTRIDHALPHTRAATTTGIVDGARRAASSTARSSCTPARSRPTRSRRTTTCCSRRDAGSTPSRSSRSSPTT